MTNPNRVDPIALGKRVGNIINDMPKNSTLQDLEIAKDAGRLVVMDSIEQFDTRVVPEENDPNLGTFDDA